MKKLLLILFLYTSILSAVEVKLKDIARIEGFKENQITGYGLVIGLPGTGDTKNAITSESLKNYLKNLGISTNGHLAKTRNIASVIVIATIPSHVRIGDKVDVTIASIGDAKSLEGGVLVQTPLRSAGNETIAVATGIISFGGQEKNKTYSTGRGYKNTVGQILRGAVVEKDIAAQNFGSSKFRVILQEMDFNTLNKVQKKVVSELKLVANAISPTEIEINIPDKHPEDYLTVMSKLENMTVVPETKAKVVINERTGVVVMGGNITIDEVAIAKQGLNLTISNKGKDDFTKSKDEKEKEENGLSMSVVSESTSVNDVVTALTKIGASMKDIIAILEGLKKAGALHAEIIVQ